MSPRSRLQNPFLLVLQGFVAGAILFFATTHESSEARPSPGQDRGLTIESTEDGR